MAEPGNPPPSTIAGHELSDLDPKKIALFGIVLTVVIIAALLASYALFHFFYSTIPRARPQPSPLSYSREPTPEPRLSVKPGDDLKLMRAEEDKILNSYDWVNRDKGIVRIPIARAVEILAQRGLPVRSQANDAAAGAQQTPPRKEREKR